MGVLFCDSFDVKRFPLPYVREKAVKYEQHDLPWVTNAEHLTPDSLGCVVKNGLIKTDS